MSLFQIIGLLYGLGVMFVIVLGMYGLAHIASTGPFRKTLKVLPKLSLYTLVGALIWPVMLFNNQAFREIVIEQGRYYIILGYVLSAIMTPVYPWVWAWYVALILCWFLLQTYHDRVAKQAE